MIAQKLANDKKRIIISGLDQDFRGRPFGPIPQLMAISEFVTKLAAICTVCGNSATRTQRLINNKPANYDDPTILIGQVESYTSRCRVHHEIPKNKNTIV